MSKSELAAVIDCGTNTFNLLIAEIKVDTWKAVIRTKRVVKLGAQGLSHGILGPAAQQRAIKALLSYREILAEKEVKKISVLGTAAIRDARNGNEFLKRVKDETGFVINLISGKEEARLIYEGVKASGALDTESALIMDIGGGSTEFILCNGTNIFWKHSFRLGAARLLEAVSPSDPLTKSDVIRLNRLLKKELLPLFEACERFKPTLLVGSSGSFDTFIALIQRDGLPRRAKTTGQKTARKKHQPISPENWKNLYTRLRASSQAERLKMPGMLAMRADMIVMAASLIEFVRKSTRIKNIQQCSYALKEGVISIMDKQSKKGKSFKPVRQNNKERNPIPKRKNK